MLSLEYDDGINVDLGIYYFLHLLWREIALLCIRLFSPDLTRHAIATSASLGDGDIYCTYAKKNEAGIEAEIKAKIFTLKNGDVSENG